MSAQPTNSPYHGQALKVGEIRLLTIIWTTADQFELRTQCHELTTDLEFDAISYVWGKAPASVPVKCNNATLLVTPTAFEMLGYLYFFSPNPERPIWVDAICINQKNADEKAVQVPLMHQIYSHAQSVVVWMGQSTAESVGFMTEMRKLPSLHLNSNKHDHHELMRQHQGHEAFWKGMASVLSREWFRRLWTFQEIILAKSPTMLCGKLWLDMDHLLEFLHAWLKWNFPGDLLAHIDWQDLTEINFIRLYRRRGGPIEPNLVPDLLHTTRLRQASEPVDRVWALYGLFDEHVQHMLAPLVDYSEEARRHYWLTIVGCMKRIVQAKGGLRLLDEPDSVGPRLPGLPSWCPNFSGRGNRRRVIYGRWNQNTEFYRHHERPFFNVEDGRSTQSRKAAVWDHDKRYVSAAETNDTLRVRGFVVDTVSEVGEDSRLIGAWDYISGRDEDRILSHHNPQHMYAVDWLSGSLDLFLRTCKVATQDWPSVLTEFLMAFWADHRVNELARTAFMDVYHALQARDLERLDLLEGGRSKSATHVLSRFRGIVGHSFFSTVGGRFGLATPGCKPGDQVCVFYGGHPLYIIRSHANNDSATLKFDERLWEFIGTAYVPHLMDQHTNDDARQGADQIFALA
jgi:hypothetical protein